MMRPTSLSLSATRQNQLDRIKGAVVGMVEQVAGNRRLAIGVGLIGLLLWVLLIGAMSDAISGKEREVAQLKGRFERAEAMALETDWNARRAVATAHVDKLLGRFWTSESDGIAQAEFQEWVSRVAREAGLGRPQVRVDLDTPTRESLGLTPIGANLSADFSPDQLTAFLAAVATSPKIVAVRNLRVQRQPIARVDALLTTYRGTPVCGARG